MTAQWILLLVACVIVQAPGQTQTQDRFALTPRQVAQTLLKQGIEIGDEQVSLPANVVASEPDPLLDILSFGLIGAHLPGEDFVGRSWVRLACHVPGTCLPFYAIVILPESALRRATIMSTTNPIVMSTVLKPKGTVTMQAGAHATLVMDDNRLHIEVAVISLENGIIGRKIHVTSVDRKRVYVAEVVSANLLKRGF